MIKVDARFSYVMGYLWLLLPTLFSLYLAPKALALARSFVEKGSQESIRPEFLHIVKVLLGLGGVILSIFMLLQFNMEAFILGLIVFVVAILLIIVCTRPGVIGIKADYPANVVEEVFGILLLPFKLVLSLLTIIVGIATVGGLVYGIVMMFDSGIEASTILAGVAFLPFLLPIAAYLVMLIALFIVDFCRALAMIPTKLDEVKEKLN